ncbi:MAG: Crossover junction endodeoxyribonuclease RuvC [candidate division WS6 bacterium OLB20]|uniref:Crossover junction endodeoxyribonuclease RuvC n=1 Tax=candidate division WS6 bacterium OLB20 TaxID=1617426 RepID=A0A136LY83_9BACT|nr:MAG: Crossover junction endodeoxyribonuclease RuvC [candidate division WS6 bacterium OLB20]
MARQLKVLGIDCGSALVGWGVVSQSGNKFEHYGYGALRTSKGDDTELRLKDLYEQMLEVVDRTAPDVMAVESVFFFRNQTTIIPVAQARGVILLAGAVKGVPVTHYTPPQVKSAVTGYGKADKTQVQRMVKQILGLNEIPKPDDVADALAVAICHLQTAPFLAKIQS